MVKKRERIDIIQDMLLAIQKKPKGIKPTHLMYKANLAHRQLKSYVEEFTKNGLISQKVSGKNKNVTIFITEKGVKLLQKIKEMKSFESAFGLE